MWREREEAAEKAAEKTGDSFKRLRCTLQSMVRDTDGVSAIEYSLLASLIVVVASVGIAALGGGVGGMWTQISLLVGAAL